MGWFWNSKSAGTSADPLLPQATAPPAPSRAPTQQEPSSPEPPSRFTRRSRPLSRDELAQQELDQFLSELSFESNHKPTYTPPILRDPASAPSEPNDASPRATKPSRSLDIPSIYPTTMSCRAAFDSAFYCNSLGGQFNNVYRHGTFRSCSEHWNDFWFCMKTKGYGDEVKGPMIREHYMKKDLKYKTGRSSEDVWEARKERVERAFDWDPDSVGART